MKCFNDCSGHGQCISLREAAIENDGYLFNRTTIYNQWDADIIQGCKCDMGWSGADCSEKSCEYGTDPRLDSEPNEMVTLVCACTGTCGGKFKLRYKGNSLRSWLYPTSKAFEIADAIMNSPAVFGNHTAFVYTPVTAANNSADDPICSPGITKKTFIKFNRNSGDLPALSFYANLVTNGELYFEVKNSRLDR